MLLELPGIGLVINIHIPSAPIAYTVQEYAS